MSLLPILLLALAGQANTVLPPELGPRVVAVAADAALPRREQDLAAGCVQRDSDGLISFVNGPDGRPLLAALTARPLADPRRDIWLRPGFTGASSPSRSTGTQDWAYVLDQDGDGQIDQIAFLIGPLPQRTGAPDEPPVPPIINGEVQLSGMAAMQAFITGVRFGFWQAVDLDGDGAADAAAWPAERKVDGWYRGWALQRLGDPPGCWLVDAQGAPEQGCALDKGSRELVGEGATAHVWAKDAARVFARIRAAAAACAFPAGSLRRAPLP